jgi:phosphoribosylaminoimidazole-succinocarboxamide synthase
MDLVYSGKVRDIYADGEDLLLVASDRISVFDVVLPTPIPDKGVVLTRMSLWWFAQLADVVANHVVSATDVPEPWAGRAVRVRRLQMLPVECIARGHLTGMGWKEYVARGTVSGVRIPEGLREGDRLPEPIFTPTTKAEVGHDEFITFDDVVAAVGGDHAEALRSKTLEVYRRGADIAAERGIIVADTKLEFGLDPQGTVVLADEVLTPDSSRFWSAEDWEPGRPGTPMDKQVVRDWAASLPDWDRTAPGPAIPEDVVATARARYIDIYERITGSAWQ